MRDVQKVELPAGTHSEVLLGEHREMVTLWTEITEKNERSILEEFGVRRGGTMIETTGALAYASVSRTAFILATVAEIEGGSFDPVEFGKRCEAIAREQIERHRTAIESGAGGWRH
jgi:hypothetical protein